MKTRSHQVSSQIEHSQPKNLSEHSLVTWILLFLLISIGAYLPGDILIKAGLPGWLAYPLAALGTLLGLILLASITDVEIRRQYAALPHVWLREFERFDFASARRAADNSGRTIRNERFNVWTDVNADVEQLLLEVTENTIVALAELTGFPQQTKWPLRLLCFDQETSFNSYNNRAFPNMGRIRGYYYGLFRKKIVMSRESANRLPDDFQGIVAHEVTHHLLRARSRRILPLWLEEGIAESIHHQLGTELCAPGTQLRYLRAALNRGSIIPAEELLSITYRQLHDYLKIWQDLNSYSKARMVYAQSTAFFTFLCDRYDESFRQFMTVACHRRDSLGGLGDYLGASPTELMQAWIDEMQSCALPPLVSPPDWLKTRIDSDIVLPILDPFSSSDDRRLAIRMMGALGYPWQADALISMLTAQDQGIRQEAQIALENIAGTTLNQGPRQWNQWYESLPAAIKHHSDDIFHLG